MKLLETYSRNTSVDIKHKPTLIEKFFPLGDITKYITIQSRSGMPAKDYSWYQEIIELINPILEKEGIKIIHLGQDAQPLQKVVNLIGQTTLGQAAFLLKRSLLHFGADSWMAHFCGAEDVPLVTLFGNTTIANHSPYFFNKDKTAFLESHRNSQKATFAREENPKTIDFIYPEEAARAICQLLNLNFECKYKTLSIGPAYQSRVVESCNDFVVNIGQLGIPNIVVRNDYNYNLDNIIKQAQIGKIAIVTNKIIPIEILQQIRPNVLEVVYELTKEHDPSFPKALLDNKIPFRLYTYLNDEELNKIKFSYIDIPQIIFRKNTNPPDLLKDKQDLSKVYYKSSKFLLGRGKIYQSLFDYNCDRAISSFESVPLQVMDINLHELYNDKEHLYFLEKTV